MKETEPPADVYYKQLYSFYKSLIPTLSEGLNSSVRAWAIGVTKLFSVLMRPFHFTVASGLQKERPDRKKKIQPSGFKEHPDLPFAVQTALTWLANEGLVASPTTTLAEIHDQGLDYLHGVELAVHLAESVPCPPFDLYTWEWTMSSKGTSLAEWLRNVLEKGPGAHCHR